MAADGPAPLVLSDAVMKGMRTAKSFSPASAVTDSLDFHHTQDMLVTGSSAASTISVFRVDSGELAVSVPTKKYGVAHIRCTHHPNNVLYATSNPNEGHALRYLSLHNNSYIRYYKGHQERVTALHLCPTSDLFLSASKDRTVRLWDLRCENSQGVLQAPGPCLTAFDEQGLIFAAVMQMRPPGAKVGETFVNLYDLRTYQKAPFVTFTLSTNAIPAEISHVCFSPNGATIAIALTDGRIVAIDAFHGKQRFSVPNAVGRSAQPRVSFTPDSFYVLSGGLGGVKVLSARNGASVAQWRVAEDDVIAQWAPGLALAVTAKSRLQMWLPEPATCMTPVITL